MIIRDMFAENINRQINGVIKVDQDGRDVIEQEVREYVITKELKKHFISFFNNYSEAIDKPTDDIGVWISGFFGSGKSHFLKMLSYILQNKDINGVPTVEYFRKKFEDDPATFMNIDKSTRGMTETILFNIDIEGSINKDKTAVLRVFAKMFYSHLGFYGENLKVAMLEQYIEQIGKTEEFRRVFEEKKGKSWLDQRKAFAFNGKFIIPTLMEVLDMSEADATAWFKDKSGVEFSISRLVEDIKSYVAKKPKNFRLLFMVDEVGQYVGTDTDMLLNLQSIVEKIGSDCGGKVWVVCTGQEAIDEIIKVRADEFSRIQARFKTRLSLSSSSVDEVIQKRILKKTDKAEYRLEMLYNENDSVLRNLFSFKDTILDIKGYGGSREFSVNYPFVPYQFTIMQKVFAEIRKHGNSGKHLSGGERSMLSGFQEAAQVVQKKDEYTIIPFFMFYDTVHSFLDSSIRRVIERCQKAAEKGHGVELYDVDVLKLLYLIRYVDDIPANADNIVILMADDIRVNKLLLREKVHASLDRLLSQNYIGRTGDTYNFLTDEEQDIQREIKNTQVDTSAIIDRIAQMVYAGIYTSKKYRYDRYDFDFDKMVDGVTVGSVTGGMKLRLLTVATDDTEKNELRLMTASKGQAIVVLADMDYYDDLESAMKINKYIKQRNIIQLPKSVQDIINSQREEATRYEEESIAVLTEAIIKGTFYVDGEKLDLKPLAVTSKEETPDKREKDIQKKKAISVLDQAMEYLVAHVYSCLNMITEYAETDADISAILTGAKTFLPGMEPNREAAAKVEEYLIIQDKSKLPTSMYDVQNRYQNVPYGWKEIDIAAVVAQLIVQQKVTIKYSGATIQPANPKLVDMLRKKSEVGKTAISKRVSASAIQMKKAREILREYFNAMDVPSDEDGLVAFIVEKFTAEQDHYEDLQKRYLINKKYPDQGLVDQSYKLVTDILNQKKDNIALIDKIIKMQDALFDSKEDMQKVEGFFANQVQVFDAAVKLEKDLKNDLEQLEQEPEANKALNQIRLIINGIGGFKYKDIPKLNDLMRTVTEGHDRLLAEKYKELGDTLTQCIKAIHDASNLDIRTKEVVKKADDYYEKKREELKKMKSLTLMDGQTVLLIQYKDQTCKTIKAIIEPVIGPGPGPSTPPVKKHYRPCQRQLIFPAETLTSEADIDEYVENMRSQLKQYLKGFDGLQIK